MNTSVKYMGLWLKNPVIIGAGPLTVDMESVKQCAEAGAGAVVLKSLFEEQISREAAGLSKTLFEQEAMHTEVYDYLQSRIDMQFGAREYLETIQKTKDSTEIPVIASLNCKTAEYWREFAAEIEAAGADALELNIGIMVADPQETAREIEEQVLTIVQTARETVDLPLAVKIGPNFSSLPEMIKTIAEKGVDGCVLFNRFWRPTIDIEREQITMDKPLSSHTELSPVLRAVSLLADKIPADICANTGIHSGADVVRALLAGAACVQSVSAPLKNGRTIISRMLSDVQSWMEHRGYSAIEDFRGNLSQARHPESELFGRTQYMKALGTNLDE